MTLHLAVVLVTKLWATHGGWLPDTTPDGFTFASFEALETAGTRHIAWTANWTSPGPEATQSWISMSLVDSAASYGPGVFQSAPPVPA